MKKTRRMMLDRAIAKQSKAQTAEMTAKVAKSAEDAKKARQKMREAEEEKEQLVKALYGDVPGNPLVCRCDVMIDDSMVGAIPPILVKFVRIGKVNADWMNDTSKYACDVVIDKNAVLTETQSNLLFQKVREVLEYAGSTAARKRERAGA